MENAFGFLSSWTLSEFVKKIPSTSVNDILLGVKNRNFKHNRTQRLIKQET